MAWAADGQAASSTTVKLALVEDFPIRIQTPLYSPLERLFKHSSSCGSIVDVRVLPSYFSGSDFRFRIPKDGDVENAQISAVALESDSEVAVIFPPVASLIDGLIRYSADPQSFRQPWTIALSSKPITLSQARGPQGEALISALLDSSDESALWHNTVARVYTLRWDNQDVTVILAGRVFGGLGKLAQALGEEAASGPPLGVARGGLFSSPQPELRGQGLIVNLERLGLRYSAVGNSEIHHWTDLQRYRSQHPNGVTFLSANLAYSTSPATTLFPASVILDHGGLKIALIGLTPPSGAKYLGQAGLSHATILDPQSAAESLVAKLRPNVDAIVLLVNVLEETERLARDIRGVDIVIARNEGPPGAAAPPESRTAQTARPDFHPPLWTLRSYDVALSVLEARIVARNGARDWVVSERHRLLDSSVAQPAGLPEFDPQSYGIALSTQPPLIRSSRRLSAHDFWTMAASLLARQANAEAALLRVWPLPVQVDRHVQESIARAWLNTEDAAVVVSIKGSALKPLLAQVEIQKQREDRGQPHGAAIRYTAGGVAPGAKIHGAAIDDDVYYRVATSRVLADALGLAAARPLGRTIDELILAGLRENAGAPMSAYERWMTGAPILDRGLWRINFRDVGLNVLNTKVVRDDAFNAVPNSRIQGFDELLIGGIIKADADYLREPYRLSNTLEMEYARSRLRPRNQPPVTNTTANRITFLTTGTRRAGLIRREWFARSWGPSLGVQYDGQFEPTPGLRRKEIYSAYPGLQFYDGSWIRTFEFSGNLKRDMSRDPPNTQAGLHARLLLSHDIGPAPIKLQGEFFTNYFFLTRRDQPQDLRLEGNAQLKLRVPISRHLTVSPFIDFYFFQLKLRPLWGYSAMTGVTIGFSRLWKPQYETLLGH